MPPPPTHTPTHSLTHSQSTHAAEHESVVKRVTTARMAQLSAAPLPPGRSASMPTTVNAKGQVLAGFRAGGGHGAGSGGQSGSHVEGGGDGGLNTASYLGGGGGGGGGISFEEPGGSEFFGGAGGLGGGGSGLRRGGDGDLSQTSTHSAAPGQGSPEARSTLRTPDSGSSRIGRSRSREREEGHSVAPLLGQLTTLLVRVKAVVLPLETCASLLGRGPTLGLLENFVPPAAPAFVAPLPFMVVKGRADPPAFEPKTRVLQFSVDGSRHREVRSVGEEVLFSLFRSVLDSSAVTEYAREALALPPAAAANPATHAAAKPRPVPAKVGVYFAEIDPSSEPAKRALALAAAGDLDAAAATAAQQPAGGESLPLLLLPPKTLGPDALSQASAGAGAGASASPARKARDAQRILKEEALEASTRAALAQPGFADLAGEILRNTMFNLMQEAAFDEFPVFAEPHGFFTVKKD